MKPFLYTFRVPTGADVPAFAIKAEFEALAARLANQYGWEISVVSDLGERTFRFEPRYVPPPIPKVVTLMRVHHDNRSPSPTAA